MGLSQEIYDEILMLGPAIAKSRDAGDKTADALMKAYEMHYDAPGDPGAQALVKIHLEAWKEAHGHSPEGP